MTSHYPLKSLIILCICLHPCSPSIHTHTHRDRDAHASHLIPVSSPLLSGKQCGECSAGFYGNPKVSGAPCQPCACNNNTDATDPESCSQLTGECLKCLHNTRGPHCQFCKPGHFGSAVNQTCRSKSPRLPEGNVAAE